jgi:hypothetical protein
MVGFDDTITLLESDHVAHEGSDMVTDGSRFALPNSSVSSVEMISKISSITSLMDRRGSRYLSLSSTAFLSLQYRSYVGDGAMANECDEGCCIVLFRVRVPYMFLWRFGDNRSNDSLDDGFVLALRV